MPLNPKRLPTQYPELQEMSICPNLKESAMVQANTLYQLKDALKAVENAPASMQGREEIVKVKAALTRAIQRIRHYARTVANVDD